VGPISAERASDSLKPSVGHLAAKPWYVRPSATGSASEGLRARPYVSCYVRAESRRAIRSAKGATIPRLRSTA
jgi:hypothetical protein